jgi:quinoprotein glucose dehydrogenase
MSRLWIALLVLVAACKGEVAGGKADGAAVFAEVCASCHGGGGTPPASMAAQLGVKDLRAPEFAARASLELIRTQVRNGSANKVMPAFGGTLTDPQIDAVAAYVLSLSGAGPASAPAPAAP